MAWPHSRVVSSRVLKRFVLGDGSGVRNVARAWNSKDGVLTLQPTTSGVRVGADPFGVGYFACEKKVGEGSSGAEESRVLNSSGFVSVRTLQSPQHEGIRGIHTSAGVASPEPTIARTAGFTAAQLEGVETIHVVPTVEEDVLQLENGALLYSGMKSKELLATLCNLQLVSFEPMVDLSLKVLTSPLMKSRIFSAPICWTVKQTAYNHFCAGEDAKEAAVTLNRMWELGLRGILDYSLEDAEDNKTCDQNTLGFLNTIHHTRALPEGSVSFACVKISAICPISLLERVSDLLRWQHKNPEFKLPWKQEGVPVLAADSPTYQTQETPDALSLEEERDFAKGQERLSQLCEACAERNLPLLVDAEYSSIQPAIDYITYGAVFEFNRNQLPVVYNTLQTYLKDAPSRLSLAAEEASRRNASLALKLVRGAYITRENRLAASVNAPSPIHDTIKDTHHCYDTCVSVMLNRITVNGSAAVMLATHNADSGRFAAKKAIQLGLDKKDPRMHFAQLKGMSDGLSMALVQGGFNVSKYLPFGPVAHVLPYLVRRAEENRGLLGNTKADRIRIRTELIRRLAVATGFKQTPTVSNV